MSEIIFKPDTGQRQIWAAARAVLEADNYKRKRSGKKSKSRWSLFTRLLKVLEFFLKMTGIYKRGVENISDIRVTDTAFEIAQLPRQFDGYRILHLSDLHIDSHPGLEQHLLDATAGIECDLCVITGDFRHGTYGSISNILKPISNLVKNIKAKDGIVAVLGNHDTYQLTQFEKETGITFLINESMEIVRGNEKIIITGTDDPFRYFTDQALTALERQNGDFKIALVHTTELFDIASRNGYSLYLCGHTHGGQICLPGGKPLITHQFEGKKFFKGEWHANGMTGYTSRGCGVSGIPLRFNCPGEVVLITLKKQN